MGRRALLRLFAVVASIALLAAACGDEGGDDGATPVDTAAPVDRADDELLIGRLLPETGDLAFLGPPMIQAVEMAVEEMNDAGGPLGLPVRTVGADTAGDAAVASESTDRLLGEGVHAIVGAAASGMSLAVIDQIVGSETVQCSPANTSPTFTDYDDGGYYFRTAPSDVLQGPVLAEVILEDGHETVAIVARGDDYGRGLANATAEALTEGGAEVVLNEIYDPNAITFDAEADAAASSEPDAVVIIPFEEGKQLMQALIEQGVSADQMYGADGIRSETLNEDIDPDDANAIDGFQGTAPSPGAVEGFIDRLRGFAPDLEETIFAPQSYDCAMLIGLAVVAADSTDPTVFAGEIVGLTTGDNECTGFEECADFLNDGETIAYNFASGTTSFRDEGEPVNGTYEVWEWQDATLESVDEREIAFESEEA